MTKQLKEIEIPFGAKDSELYGWEYTIPEGMEATILDNKIVVKKKENEDDKMKRIISDILLIDNDDIREILESNDVLMQDIDTWLEKQDGLTIRFFTDEFEWALGRIIAFWNQKHKDGKYDENELMSYIKVRETELVKLFTDNVCKISLSDCSEEYRKAYYDGYNKCNRDWLKIKDISVDEYNKNTEILLGVKTPEESLGIDSDTYNKIVDECIYDEQKPAWNEEDKNMVRFIGNAITTDDASIYLKSIGIEVIDAHVWLEELKDRVQPQNKWKESLATADLENSLCDMQDGFSDTSYEYRTLGEAIEFIRCTEPKPQWKPSDEQMGVIEAVINNRSFQRRHLDSLYQDLKKLKGE